MESMFTAPNFLTSNLFGDLEGFRKFSADSAKRLEGLNLKLAENLLKKQAELVSAAMDAGNRAAALYGKSKALPELMTEQAKLASDYGNRLFMLAQETGAVLADSQGEFRSWFEEGCKSLTEQWQCAAPEFVPVSKTA